MSIDLGELCSPFRYSYPPGCVNSVILNTNSIPSTANTKKNLFRKNQVKKLGESGKSLFLCFPHGGIDKLST